jgi:predicted metal-dependent hydrolase
MADRATVAGIEVALRRSARARRISLRVSGLDGRVTLTVPTRVPETEALRFAMERADWLHRAVGAVAPPRVVVPGAMLPVEGRFLRVEAVPGRGALRCGPGVLSVPGDPALLGTRVAAFLRHLARDRLAAACDRHATRLGRRPARMVLRDTRSRWGSCTAGGVLMFSWRLAMAPPEVLDYVAAHEVAHLARMDHSPAFWAEVAGLMPGYDAPRRWLRAEGATLHAWRFGG